jgi:hypothetical protein
MRRALALRCVLVLAVLALGACAAGSGPSGPYVGGAVGGNLRDDARTR